MADENEKEAQEANAKLKEIEQTLAKELDHQVRLTEPTDPRLDGSIALNPTLDVSQPKKDAPPMDINSAAVASTPSTIATAPGLPPPNAAVSASFPLTQPPGGKKVDDISLQDVDDLLTQLDSNFQTSMDEIKSEVGKINTPLNLESISIGADYLKGEEGAAEAEPAVTEPKKDLELTIDEPVKPDSFEKKPSLLGAVFKMAWATAILPLKLSFQTVKEVFKLRKYSPKEIADALPDDFLPHFKWWLGAAGGLFSVLRRYSFKSYFKLILFCAAAWAFQWVVRDIMTNPNLDKEKDPFLRSFSEVANEIQLLPEDDTGEDLESPLKHPEYTVLLSKIVANLKPPSPRRSPMIILELYLEASNQDCAIEINDRHVEIKDLIERILEQTTFDEVESIDGKNRLKIRIRAGLNHILNKGRVRRLFFKSFNVQK